VEGSLLLTAPHGGDENTDFAAIEEEKETTTAFDLQLFDSIPVVL
jgi:hypothetical protein